MIIIPSIKIAKEKIKSFCIVIAFIMVVSFLLSEVYIRLLPNTSLYTIVFLFSAPMTWLLLDNITLCLDLKTLASNANKPHTEKIKYMQQAHLADSDVFHSNTCVQPYPHACGIMENLESENHDSCKRKRSASLSLMIASYHWTLLAAKYRRAYYIHKIKFLNDFSRSMFSFANTRKKMHTKAISVPAHNLNFTRTFTTSDMMTENETELHNTRKNIMRRWRSFNM